MAGYHCLIPMASPPKLEFIINAKNANPPKGAKTIFEYFRFFAFFSRWKNVLANETYIFGPFGIIE